MGAGVHLPMESWQATGPKPASPSPSSLTLIPENCQEPQARQPVASSLKQCPGHTNLLLPASLPLVRKPVGGISPWECVSVTLTLSCWRKAPPSFLTNNFGSTSNKHLNHMLPACVFLHFAVGGASAGPAQRRPPGLPEFGTLPSCVRLMSLSFWPQPRAACGTACAGGCIRSVPNPRLPCCPRARCSRKDGPRCWDSPRASARRRAWLAELQRRPQQPRHMIRLVCASPRPGASNYTSGACRSPGGRLT